jgi:fluoroquinolone transport system permease protein
VRAAALWSNDLRNVIRDRTAAVLLVMPPVMAATLRAGSPLVEQQLPLAAAYRLPAVALFCQVAGAFPALMLAFIMLDEKDEGLFPAFRVLPMSPRRFLFTRLSMVAVLGMLYAALVIAGSGLTDFTWPETLLLAIVCGLQAPLVALVIVSVAGNKIEGLAVIKGVFPAVIFPVAALLAESSWTRVFAVLPAFWIYHAFAAPDLASLALYSSGALALYAVLTALSYRLFRRRVLP